MIENQLLTRPWAHRREVSAPPEAVALPAAETLPLTPEAQAALVASLVRFLIMVGMISSLFCLYVWQLSTILTIEKHTGFLYREVDRLERENVSLMIEVAQDSTPAQIEQRAYDLGMVPSVPATRVSLDGLTPAGQLAHPAPVYAELDPFRQQVSRLVAWWQAVRDQLPQLPFGIN